MERSRSAESIKVGYLFGIKRSFFGLRTNKLIERLSGLGLRLELGKGIIDLQLNLQKREHRRHGECLIAENLLNRLAGHIEEVAVLIAERIDTGGSKFVERQKGRRFAEDLTRKGSAALTPVCTIACKGVLIGDCIGIAEKEIIPFPLGTVHALHGEKHLALRRSLSPIVHGKHNVIQCSEACIDDGMLNCLIVLRIFASNLTPEGHEIVHLVLNLTHSRSFQSGLPLPYSMFAVHWRSNGTEVAPHRQGTQLPTRPL